MRWTALVHSVLVEDASKDHTSAEDPSKGDTSTDTKVEGVTNGILRREAHEE